MQLLQTEDQSLKHRPQRSSESSWPSPSDSWPTWTSTLNIVTMLSAALSWWTVRSSLLSFQIVRGRRGSKSRLTPRCPRKRRVKVGMPGPPASTAELPWQKSHGTILSWSASLEGEPSERSTWLTTSWTTNTTRWSALGRMLWSSTNPSSLSKSRSSS